MDSIQGVVNEIRIFMYGGVVSLPLTISGTMLILGMFTGNYAMLFFLLGFLVITPIFVYLLNIPLNKIIPLIFELFSDDKFLAKNNSICSMSGSKGSDQIEVLSAWVAMIAFFIGYVFTNGIELYNHESPVTDKSAEENKAKVNNRKTQAIIGMISIIILLIVSLLYRYKSECSSPISILLTFLLFSYGGYKWYKFLSVVGNNRLSDIFGIANRLIAQSAIQNGPIACIPIKV